MFYTNAFLIEPFNYKIARRKRGEALNDINTLTAETTSILAVIGRLYM